MRALATSLLCGLLGGLALAAEKPKDAGADASFVNVTPVALPIVVNGQLVNYVFVSLRLNLAPSANISAVREKEPYFRDALVRMAYRQPFIVPTNYAQVDVPALKARMMTEAARIVGPGVVISVVLVGDPQPKRVTGLPNPKGAPPPPRAPIP
jgi:hypothetical protein